ncbi:MAG: serine hydrolase [Janthinobacterium lividum]
MQTRFLFLAGLLGVATLTAQAQQLNTAKLDSLLTTLGAHNKLMGSVMLSHDGKVIYSKAVGYAQLDGATKVPATADTRYRVGSLTKMFTATMIMQLIEEKKLTLATPLATFFPQLPNAKTITIDQLLSHRSGLHDFATGGAQLGHKTSAEMVTILSKTTPDFEPGAKFAYSNSNYVVLGYILEKLTKQAYAQALQKRIVARAGLQHTYYGGKIDPAQQEAFSYERNGAGWKLGPETDMSVPGGAGAIVSTAPDINRFLEALFGGKLVTAASLKEMETVRDKFGRGLIELPFNSHASYGHGGIIDDFRTMASYFPAEKLALVVCSNSGLGSVDDVTVGMLSTYFNQPYKIPTFAASTFVPTPADLDRYAGSYASTQLPLKITMTKDGTTLKAQATGQSAFPLEPVSQGIFKFDQAGVRVEFDSAKAAFTLKQGGKEYSFTKE